MDTATGTMVGACVGAGSAFVGALLNSWSQVRLERIRWPRQREDALAAEYRLAVKGLATNMAAALHSMCWLTWVARKNPLAISQKRIEDYDTELHHLLPEITGTLASVAALDPLTYEKFHPLTERLYRIDARIGEACAAIESAREKSIASLADSWDLAQKMDKELPREIAGIVGARIDERAGRILA